MTPLYTIVCIVCIALRIFTASVIIPEIKGPVIAMGVDLFFHIIFLLLSLCLGSKPASKVQETSKGDTTTKDAKSKKDD